jgi:hypothetical protein
MDYHKCPLQDSYAETRRRGLLSLLRSRDQLNEGLMRDDDDRGSNATTICTMDRSILLPRVAKLAQAGNSIVASHLVNESTCAECTA